MLLLADLATKYRIDYMNKKGKTPSRIYINAFIPVAGSAMPNLLAK